MRRGLPHLLFHVSMESQEVQRLVFGRGATEDGFEEAEEELHRFTARHEDDHLVPLGKLHRHTLGSTPGCRGACGVCRTPTSTPWF